MMKKKNIVALTVSIGLGIASISGITLTAVSCNESSNISNKAYEFYNEFVTNTHGRWAGNYANFVQKERDKNFKEHTFGQYGLTTENLTLAGFDVKNPKQEIKLFHEFDKDKKLSNKDPDGIGSHYAYEWLVDKIKSFGLNDLGGDYTVSKGNVINYPKEAKVEFVPDSKNPGKTKLELSNADSGIKFVDSAEGDEKTATIKDQIGTKPYFQEKGFITQGYLWNGRDRITGKQVANQYSQNIIVTIKALDKNGNPKFPAIKSADELQNVNRTAFWITSHYDSTGTEGIDSKSWGATDNGSGVGATLDLIEYYTKDENAKKLPCDLNIAFVGGEEVGVTGSTALVGQFFSDEGVNKVHRAQIGGMLNLDTAAGGDNVYVHSPWTKLYILENGKLIENCDSKDENYKNKNPQSASAATGTLIRDQLNAISKMQADTYNNKNAELQIHPFITPVKGAEGYLQGQTGDWSDHASFYKTGISNVAYIEATNFQINGNTGYDGYSQVSNPVVWSLKKEEKISNNKWKDCTDDEGKLITKQPKVVKSQLEGQAIDVWDLDKDELKEFQEGGKTYRWNRNNSGAIWHWDFDRPDFMNKNFPDRMKNQLTNLGETLRTFFKIMNISTFNADLNKKTDTLPPSSLSLLKEYSIPTIYTPSNLAIVNQPLKIAK